MSTDDDTAGRRPPAGRRDRRLLGVAGSVALVAVSIATFAGLYSSADRKTAVLVLIRPLAMGQVVTGADLGVADVSLSGGVDDIPVSAAAILAGRRADGALPQGTLLTLGELTVAPAIASGDAVVGVALKDGTYPASGLSPGDQVMVVQTAGAGVPLTSPTTGSATSVEVSPLSPGSSGGTGSGTNDGTDGTGVLVSDAVIFATAAPGVDSSSGASLLASIEVPTGQAAAVSTAAAAGQVSLVLLSAGRGTQ